MTDDFKLVIREALEKILAGAVQDEDNGICWQLSYILPPDFVVMSSTSELVGVLAEGWAHHSGVRKFPIPPPLKKGKSASWYYLYSNVDKWKGRQLRLRQSLIRHMIEKLSCS